MFSRYLLLCATLCFLFFAAYAHAATTVPGTIGSDITFDPAGSPYIIGMDVTVKYGVTLSIAPGAVVEFTGPYTLKIIGALVARGNSTDPVVFRASVAGVRWKAISFDSNSIGATVDGNGNYVSGSILEYAHISGAGDGGSAAVVVSGAQNLMPPYAAPYFQNVTLEDNTGGGIRGQNLLNTIVVRDSVITGNNVDSMAACGGICLSGLTLAGSRVVIENNQITNNGTNANGGGIMVSGFDSVAISGNTVTSNHAAIAGGGIHIQGLIATKDINKVANNTLSRNSAVKEGGGLYFLDAHMSVLDNLFTENTSEMGGGLVFKPYSMPIKGETAYSVDIMRNIIFNNSASAMGGAMHFNHVPDTFSIEVTISENVIADNSVYGDVNHGGGIDIHKGQINFTHNIVAGNSATIEAGALRSSGTNTLPNIFSDNVFVANKAADIFRMYTPSTLQGNTIVRNFPETAVFELSDTSYTITGNNIVDNMVAQSVTKNISYNGTGTVDASNNWWGTVDEAAITNRINNPTQVSILPIANDWLTLNPLSPPNKFSALGNGSQIQMTWDANPEADVAGYIVHWSDNNDIFFENASDVGNVTTTNITLNSGGVQYYAVTAYDDLYSPGADNSATRINENQIAGHESWFSKVVAVSVIGADLSITSTDMPTIVGQNATFNFSLTARNKGPNGASGITITLTPVAGLSITSIPDNCQQVADSVEVTCTLATLLPGNVEGSVLNFSATTSADFTSATLSTHIAATEQDFNLDDNDAVFNYTLQPPDSDKDGVSDVDENNGPNGGDSNRDGIADSTQAKVVSLRNGDAYISVVYPDAFAGANLKTIVPVPEGLPEHVTALSAMLSFQITAASGSCGDVGVYLDKNSQINRFYIYETTGDGTTTQWRDYANDGSTGADVFQDAKDTRIVLHLCIPAAADGGTGEQTLTVSGMAVNDPGQPLVAEKKKKKDKWFGAFDPLMLVVVMMTLALVRMARAIVARREK